MGDVDEDPVPSILERLGRVARDSKIPKELQDKLHSSIEFLKTILLEEPDEEEGEEKGCGHEECPACSGSPLLNVKQIMPAPAGLKAVFAEGDRTNPNQMEVSDVVALAVMEDGEGDTFITGISMEDDFFVECQAVSTFMGYIREGESPDKYAGKVREFLSKRRDKHEPG